MIWGVNYFLHTIQISRLHALLAVWDKQPEVISHVVGGDNENNNLKVKKKNDDT